MIVVIGCVLLILVSIIAAWDIDRYSLYGNKRDLNHDEVMRKIKAEHDEVKKALKLGNR